jgi:predicted nucleic acid-binding protein
MPTVFVDTVAWIALLNISGGLHTPAQQVMHDVRQQNVQLVTTEFVLIEVADALSAPSIRAHTVTFINGLRQLAILHIIPANPGLLADGWTLYSQRPDKEWGWTDCTSFVVMTQEHMTLRSSFLTLSLARYRKTHVRCLETSLRFHACPSRYQSRLACGGYAR